MKLKNVLCIAALSAAVALTGVPQSTTALVYAEETQIAGLDEILRSMYALYTAGDYASMYTLDTDAATEDCVELIQNSGSDRYVIDIDSSTKAMVYVTSDGSYWWYFGQMENNLRQGNGTTIILGSSTSGKINTIIFTGSYTADFPNGTGKLSRVWVNDGSRCDISGTFQGRILNGIYQVDASWDYYGTLHSSSRLTTYANNSIQSIDGGLYSVIPDGEYTKYYYGNEWQFVNIDSTASVVALNYDDDYYCNVWTTNAENYSQEGLEIFKGNGTSSVLSTVPAATPEAPADTVPVPEAPAVTTPTPTTLSGTYTVERGDNLSKIAQKVYGDQKLWRKIYEANSNVIKSDYVIYASQVLTIPAL